MAQAVYDPDADERPLHRPDRPGKDPAGQPADAAQLSAQESDFYQPEAAGTSEVSSGTDTLRQAESSPDGSSLFRPSKDTPGRMRSLTGRLRSLAKKKWVLGVGAGGAGFLIMLAFFMFFLGSLKIPQFMEHVTTYQFVRVTRQMARNSENITSEKMAVDATDDSTFSKLKAQYENASGKAKETWSKLDKYRPNKLISNYGTDGTLKLNYVSSGPLGLRQRLVGITLGDRTVLVQQPSGLARFNPVVGFRNDVQFARDVAPTLKTALKADDVGPIVRSAVAKEIRQRLGIGLIAWKVGAYTGKSPDEARLQQARDMYRATTQEGPIPSKTGVLNEATNDAERTLAEDIQNDTALESTLANEGNDPKVVSAISNLFNQSILTKAIDFLNPAYAVALPVCLVYDGSLVNNGPTIDTNNDRLQREYYYAASAADQQKDGYKATGEAVGAFNDQLGDISGSNAELRASGESYTTSNYKSVQSSPADQYSIADALLPGPAGTAANYLFESVCPVATSLTAGVGLAVLNIGGCFFTAGTSCLGEKAAQEGAETIAGRAAGRMVGKFASDQAAKKATALGGILTQGVKGLGKTIVGVGAATILARAIVYDRLGSSHNGLQSGTTLANDIDNGGNLMASSLNQQANYARPLTDVEIAQSHQADQQFQIAATAKESAFERYASLANPDSLLTRFGTLAMNHLKPDFITSLAHLGSLLAQPLNGITSLYTSFDSKLAFADTTASNSDYGNVVWGYSAEEENLLETDTSYMPLENQAILDAHRDSAGNPIEDDIDHDYHQCFDGSESIGTMLANGDIQRDENGNVLTDKGTCSPDNLGPHNPKYGDLVFRWRVAHSYDNSLNQMLDQQEATP